MSTYAKFYEQQTRASTISHQKLSLNNVEWYTGSSIRRIGSRNSCTSTCHVYSRHRLLLCPLSLPLSSDLCTVQTTGYRLLGAPQKFISPRELWTVELLKDQFGTFPAAQELWHNRPIVNSLHRIVGQVLWQMHMSSCYYWSDQVYAQELKPLRKIEWPSAQALAGMGSAVGCLEAQSFA